MPPDVSSVRHISSQLGLEMLQRTVLPSPRAVSETPLESALAMRRSVRAFTSTRLTSSEIGQLAWAGQGVSGRGHGARTCPSAGALYPLELYVLDQSGLYQYEPGAHALVMRSTEDLRAQLAAAALHQECVARAPCVFAIIAAQSRTSHKYGARSERYVYLEAGHCAQNILLAATALGLGAVPVGAFEDEGVSTVLSLGATASPIYLIPVGHAMQ